MMRCKGGKSASMTLALKGRFLQIHQGNFVLINVPARNPLGAAHGRSQGKPPKSCKANPHLLHPVQAQQGGALLTIYALAPLLIYKSSSLPSSATIHTFQGSRDPELFMDSRLRWEETIISRMWLLGRLARKKYTNIRNVKGFRHAFGASFMKISTPQS